jgi:para-aminobenzoate synthetase component I
VPGPASPPVVGWAPPRLPVAWRDRLVEVDRLEWRRGDPGEPAALVEDYLHGAGFAVRDLASGRRGTPAAGVAGAAVLLGAEACAAASVDGQGLPPGPASPVPEVPDVAVVLLALAESPGPAPRAAPQTEWQVGSWSSSWSPEEHALAVEGVRAAIGRGDVYQVDLVGHSAARTRGDPAAALARVAGLSGATYGGAIASAASGSWGVATASMECMLRVAGGTALTVPVKGTVPVRHPGDRGEELRGSVKDRAEHVMIVDLERHDLARVAVAGGVAVDELYAVTRWADLWHAESTVSARLRPGTGLAELLHATLPGGSVTGAPKRAALEQMARWEPVGRGPSMGAFGTVTPSSIDLGLSIRTVAAAADRVHLWTGGGVTWGSSAAGEVAEARAKAEPIRAALAAGA